ncbi:N-acetyltransferase [Nordella sp. HKS 07]|uniref:N-acetyltransferase n=1 Tax=Nordella sp. HKS 07 TaxID=2712222 RepID=UPI0013E12B1E|nr:N-acetyltransferase [Nordella sp. HKS 07]QIG46530.1 N-acetyltransferase [Nordella sp. HKS 07]
MSLRVAEVRSAADRKAFLRVPHLVFAGDPNWVAPLDLERREHLDPRKNPYFRHAEAQLFVAYDGDRPVGRISAQLDRLRLEHHRDGYGQFGFLDAVDDARVFAALLGTAEDWLRKRDLKATHGPFSFSINDEMGLLIKGFDTPPSMMMGHALPYYARHLESQGYVKAKDVLAYDYEEAQPMPEMLRALLEKVKARGNLVIRPLSKKNLDRDLAIIIDIFNDAWSENWGFVPMTHEEIVALGKNLKMLVNEEYISIASYKDEPAAMAITLPNLNDWIKDLNGRLLPLGWAKLAWRLMMTPPQSVRMPLMGVRRRYHRTTLGSALTLAVVDSVRAYHISRGTVRAEFSWVLEENLPMRRIIESNGGTAYKTYRIYEKSLT